MSIKNLHPRSGLLLLFILAAAVVRVLGGGHLAPFSNITPIGAMALFGGAYFSSQWKSYGFPLLALFVSDVLIMRLFYPGLTEGLLYSGWIWTYLAFAVMVLIGQLAIKQVSGSSVMMAAVIAALAHWLIADFGAWLSATDITTGKPYTKDSAGLLKCYMLGIPYMQHMLIGNLIYCTILFGGMELVVSRFPAFQK